MSSSYGKPPIEGTLYDSGMGPLDRESIDIGQDGRIKAHYIDSTPPGARVTWEHGVPEDPHLVDQGYPKTGPQSGPRHPFGR